ncbi:MAG: hypothetical protein AB4050_18105 [Synechococcus sp.]
MALAPSNPDIIYVGMGEPNMRDSHSWGNGVYKSTDGGSSWTHLGMEETMIVARMRVHPTNPDLVYMAVPGNAFGPSRDRGVYRSNDGGQSWEQVLFKSDVAGAIDLVMDETNPNVLYASIFQFQRKTWGAYSGGPDSGIWKSTDGGNSWTELTRNPGLPEGQLGRIGLAHSPAMPNRITALVDSETKTGVYQSDDGGGTWTFISADSNVVVRPFYFMHLFASPVNGDEFWVCTNKLWQSTDGGKTWVQRTGIKDDFHDLWIDPKNPMRMICTCDGGTMVTLTGGKTWTTPWTQPTAQGYRVEVDDQFPYNLYGNFQDLIGYKVPSASIWGGISNNDVTIFGSGEAGCAIPDPRDPNIIWHGSPSTMVIGGGAVQRINLVTGQWEHKNVWPETYAGRDPKESRYRFNWHAPIVLDPFDPDTVYFAAEVVFRTQDQGQNWEAISPVLTLDDESRQLVTGAPWMPESSGQEFYNTIHRMVASKHEQGVLWTGSDDGLVHITRDGGRTWQNVSPDFPPDTDVYELEVSPHDPATLYLAASRYRTANDFKPYLYKTTDYGKTWANLSDNFPQGEITRTIREDTVRKGLLFVGTETGLFGSIDDGQTWNRMNYNLPAMPVHDLKVKNEDLAIVTHARGFWILDDISPLRQYDDSMSEKKFHLFKPRPHTRLGRNWWSLYGGGVGGGQKNYFVQNHRPGHTFYELGVEEGIRKRKFIEGGDAQPDGPIIYYLLSDRAQEVSLTILDEAGQVIKTFTEDEIETQKFITLDALGYTRETSEGGSARVSVIGGLNRYVWDMNYPSNTLVPGKPPSGIIPMAKPGTYQVRLTVDGESQTETFELRINPNETYTQAETDARFDLWMKALETVEKGNLAIIQSMEMVESLKERVASGTGGNRASTLLNQIETAATTLSNTLVPVGKTLIQIINEPSTLVVKMQTIHWGLFHSEGAPPASFVQVHEMLDRQFDEAIAAWNQTMETDVAELNRLLG